jgi:hypothetical protein
MWDKFKAFLEFASKNGMWLPMAREEPEGKPSFTLLCVYATFVIMACSLIALHIWPDRFVATCTTICAWVLAMVFYRLRKLTKAKVDLDDKSIELDGGDDEASSSSGEKASSEKTE